MSDKISGGDIARTIKEYHEECEVRMKAEIEQLREDNERLRKLLKECKPFIEAYDPWDCELIDEIEKEVGDECD